MRGEMAGIRIELRGEISSVCAEMGAMRNQFHADIMMLINISNELDKRIGRLGDKG